MLHHYKIKFSSHNLRSIKEINKCLEKVNGKNKTIVSLPKDRKIFTVTKSPHVNNKAKEHFKIEKFKRLVCLKVSRADLKKFIKKIPNDLFVKIVLLN
jgi:small subunit ribosomal protein S10